MKNETWLLAVAILLTILSQTGCSTGGSGTNDSRPREQKWSLEDPKLSVLFHSESDMQDGAFYEIRSQGKTWRVPAPVYQPNKIGVDGLRMRDYAEQKVYISPRGGHIAIVENAGGEDVANLLLVRQGDDWRAKRVAPGVEFFKKGKVLPFSMITGVADMHVLFGGYPVPFSKLRVHTDQKITLSAQ